MTHEPPVLAAPRLPRHVAVVMDGNGRWAKRRNKARALGHRAGVSAARRIVRACHSQGIEVLTLFAFSQENWQRPPLEVRLLMELFVRTLGREIDSLHRNGVRIRFIGDHADFPESLRELMREATTRTAANEGLVLVIAAGYGGQWDIAQAAQRLCAEGLPLTPANLESRLVTADLPHPDLLIRTGGEKRISNFLLWQLAYSELYFSDVLWPDFDAAELERALHWYSGRERRFGRVPESA
ncbi:polyprenyl diphosphate synthase [Nevskia soli]|uniref:polyprenyl diphosphate synthase n=1 Tax=Nevskia soli TaxID=418856 RepID=UPI00055ADC2D|nr:polyprenyl diphosphate synthase [Nevskia soli]